MYNAQWGFEDPENEKKVRTIFEEIRYNFIMKINLPALIYIVLQNDLSAVLLKPNDLSADPSNIFCGEGDNKLLFRFFFTAASS